MAHEPACAQPGQAALSTAARQRGLVVLLLSNLLMFGGFFMIIPLLSVRYVDQLGWAAGTIGAVLGIRQVLQQGLTLFGGALADRFGAKAPICVGLGVRTLGFAGMIWADTLPILLVMSILAAVGGALFDAPSSAAIAALTDGTNRVRYYALRGVSASLGMTLGPLAGAALLHVDFDLVCLASAACFALTMVLNLLALPDVQVAIERQDLLYGIRLAMRNRPFVIFTALGMGFWFMWVQLTIALPLVARNLAGTTDAVSWVYTLSSGLTLLLQYPLTRLSERRLRPMVTLVIGMALMAAGLGLVGLAGSVAVLLACVALHALGAMLCTPALQTVTADLAGRAAMGSFFGVSALALAFGGGIGNYLGGTLYQAGQDLGLPALPWAIFALVGLICAAGMAWLARHR